MKKKTDPRHRTRIEAFKILFEESFRYDLALPKNDLASQVLSKQKELDKLIAQNAPAWPIEQIAPVDLATLRLAIWELLFKKKKEPYKVVIDEAIEIAKEYGSESSSSFINGVLGTIIKSNIKSK
ncbi:transcription antitermination factor NusB [Candidatus Curtissbacteria bacterium]|nr:transcription antitermination factor NusB [Candidatus Curtissbacteria bacterium]MBI2594470.1 transcription antitermination factor NusB [Candidatus Curtissbacteria bacterium]